MNRREFLAAVAAAACGSLSFSGKLFAAPPGTPRFLLVFLRGGYDCNNLLVP
ncbi:MAG TPA: twin-arginine translocation signal domain-containing protein, partial [Polyangia bacterium]